MIKLDNDWMAFFDEEQVKPYYIQLRHFLVEEYKTKTIYPPMEEIFSAFKLTSFSETKVIIVGDRKSTRLNSSH